VLHRPKMSFVFPWEPWLRQELRGCIAETLLDSAAVGAAGLNTPPVAALWQGFLSSQPGLRYTDVLCLSHSDRMDTAQPAHFRRHGPRSHVGQTPRRR
jgi:2-methylcitrate dehydratase PrpD